MRDDVKNMLSDLSFEELRAALEAKKESQIEILRKQRREIRKEQAKVNSEFERRVAAVDRQLEELTGKSPRATSATRRNGRSGELTSAILKVLGVAPGRRFDAAGIVAELPSAGFSGDLEDARKKMAIYLSRLVKANRIVRVDRGLYTANTNKDR